MLGPGNCPKGGSVKSIGASVTSYSGSGSSWSTNGYDAGDDIIYPRVRLNATNYLAGKVYCDRPWYKGVDYWADVYKSFKPTRAGQNIWL